jgi:hypothetical protein
VFLNHFYVVLDSETYKAIEEDGFLRKRFAPNETRTTVRADQTYTGLYFYGTNTYFEFFDVSNSPRPRVGDSGIAFGVDRPGALKVLQERLGPSLEILPEPITRLYQARQVPWFFMATSKNIPYESGMSTWIMEYHPEFLAKWNPRSRTRNRGVSRREILKRYAEVLKPVKDAGLKDVVGLTVATDERTRENFIQLCRQFGYRTKKEKDEAVALHGPDFVLRLVPEAAGVRGVREIRLNLRRPSSRAKEWHFGRSMLKFKGRAAVWTFA